MSTLFLSTAIIGTHHLNITQPSTKKCAIYTQKAILSGEYFLLMILSCPNFHFPRKNLQGCLLLTKKISPPIMLQMPFFSKCLCQMFRHNLLSNFVVKYLYLHSILKTNLIDYFKKVISSQIICLKAVDMDLSWKTLTNLFPNVSEFFASRASTFVCGAATQTDF